jgi:pimeloyl-ACP methyl ester carboxylesterase
MAVASLRSGQEFELVTPAGRRLCGSTWPGQGASLVFLHGLLDCAAGWDGMARSMRRPSIALDLPGFGGSDLPTRPRISAYAELVTWALAELDLSEVVLVGHSLGGAVATAVAERAPERIRSLVLLAPAGFGRMHLAEAISIPGIRNLTAAALPLALANPLVLTAAYMTMVTAGELPEAEMLQRVMRQALRGMPGARDATRAVVAAGLSAHGFHRRRVAFDGPVAAVWGARDHLVPPGHAAGLRRALPQAAVHVWSGMGHHPQRERPGALAELIETAATAGGDALAPQGSASRVLAFR